MNLKLLSSFYRAIPYFKGKNRLGMWLFKKVMYQKNEDRISGRHGLHYHIINTSDSIGRELFLNGVYEKRTIRLLTKLLRPGKIMVDAGANIGTISMPVAKTTGADIYAFEPSTLIFSVLSQNILENKLSNIHPYSLALSDKKCTADFYESDRVHGWSGLVEIESFKKYPVQAVTLDEFCGEHGIEEIEVLKIDVQGWEYAVLKGAERLLQEKAILHIIFEVEQWAEENAGLPQAASQQFLKSNDYEIFTLKNKKIPEPVITGTHILWAKPRPGKGGDK